MTDVFTRPALAYAMQARAASWEALDRDDIDIARRLIRLADGAVETLCRPDAVLYGYWLLDHVPDAAILSMRSHG